MSVLSRRLSLLVSLTDLQGPVVRLMRKVDGEGCVVLLLRLVGVLKVMLRLDRCDLTLCIAVLGMFRLPVIVWILLVPS